MGRIFEALQRSNAKETSPASPPECGTIPTTAGDSASDGIDFQRVRTLRSAGSPEHHLVCLDSQRSLGSERIRMLAGRLRHWQNQRLMKKLLITSTLKGEGKTVLSANLAISLAKTRQRVLLLDGDSHEGNAARILAGPGLPGLADWWRSKDPIENFFVRLNEISLWLLPSGNPRDQMLEMLPSVRLSTQMSRISACFDWIIMDSPPWPALADAASWGQLADGILIVTREARTPKRLLKKVLESLDQSKLLGIVLNDCSGPDQQYYLQYYRAQKP